jgi:hypothetical protein
MKDLIFVTDIQMLHVTEMQNFAFLFNGSCIHLNPKQS